ncbi:MAG TPA: hypothetical protein VNT81_01465 [Vicinamibacterales bacterium]|nr:hypothetical protein [Vicinamibacterales bacterium]
MNKHNATYPPPPLHLTNRILAVVDDAESVREILDDLAVSGVAGHVTALSGADGVAWIDEEGLHGGRLTRFVRGLQRWSVEGHHLHRYAAELANGRYVIDVHTPPFIAGERTLTVLRDHHAHFINAYNQWTIESLAV